MKQVIELAALVEDLSSEAVVEEKLRLSAENGQISVEVEAWDSRFEVPTDQLIQAIQSLTLAPTEPPVSLTMMTHLGQKLSRLEQQVAATPHQRLELEGFRENLEAFRREIIPRLVLVETWKARLESLEAVADQKGLDEGLSTVLLEDFDRRIKVLEAICHDCGGRLAKLEQFETSQVPKNAEITALQLTLDEQNEMLLYIQGQLDTLRNAIAEPPAETAALALYGGEQ